ncbi:MAG: NAD-dependent protein deacylase [Kofleriaceae bacterium]|jgi:NAD-dependent deacetylase|nr:NAD-dependent protein deacylase [Kofleriaceae bacterium]MBP6838298.1 NAD-dependent protein deacylase [Kofleriaceae bacterium]MBP9206582.1 NAD-dependent protein deacylase [Kofleriaceae bacterium]
MARPRRTTLRRDQLDLVAHLLWRAGRVLFVTGAEVSAESGLPGHRGVGGLASARPEDGADGLAAVDAALSAEMLALRPQVTWRHLAASEERLRAAAPNPAHQIMAALEATREVVVATANVDGLHGRAGSRRVIELHGNLRRLRCVRCDFALTVPSYQGVPIPPACPQCQALVRPDLVLFGELLATTTSDALERELARGFELVVAVGTRTAAPYLARPILLARQAGVPTAEIGLLDSELSPVVDLRLRARPARVMAALWARRP